MYDTFDNQSFCYCTSSSFDHRNREYLLSRYSPMATWCYGDSIEITFNIYDCNLTDSVEYLDDKELVVKFYNFRYEELPFISYFVPNSDGEETITVSIDNVTSMKYFPKGTYHCSIDAVKRDQDNNIIYQGTILKASDSCFYVE